MPTRPAARRTLVLTLFLLMAGSKALQAQVVGVSAEDASLRIRYEKGARVVLFYSATCPASRAMFPSFVALARRYAAVGVTFLAYSEDDDPLLVERYLGPDVLPFERAYILPHERGGLRRALAADGIRVPSVGYTPSVVVLDATNRIVGQYAGVMGTTLTERWLRRLGFRAD